MNLDGVECLDDACINQLTWLSDGSAFTTRHSTDKIDMKSTSDQQPCTVFKTDNSTADKNCRDQKYFTCQFSCNAGTYGNCRLLLFSYNRMLKIFKYRGHVQGGPSASGKRYVDSKFEVAFSS